MSPQHDAVISNASGAAVRADLNNALAALITNSSGATSPATTYAFQFWADTTASQLKIRNAANDAWIVLMELDGTMLMEDGTAAAPGLSFSSDLDTGLFRPAANQLGIATSGVERVEFGTTEVVFNDSGADVDFRVEGDAEANLLKVDAGNDRIGIAESAPGTLVEIGSTAPYVTLKNSTEEDTDGGRESRLIFEGEQSGGEISTLAQIEVSHDGTADDEKGKLVISTNDGSDGASPTAAVTIDSSRRLLVGTSSASAQNTVTLQANSLGSDGSAYLQMRRGEANPGAFDLGVIQFADSAGSVAATITGTGDATWGTNDYPGRLTFSTTADGASSPTERMRITSDGLVFIGDSSPTLSGRLSLARSGFVQYNRCTGTGAGNIPLILERASDDGTSIEFKRAGSVVGNINVTSTTTNYVTSSDYRLKENVVDLDGAITRVKQLSPKRFNFIADADTTVDGFLAHEAQAVVPEAITGTHNEVDADGNPIYQGIDQSKLVPLLTAALQEAIAKIETLENKVAALEAAS